MQELIEKRRRLMREFTEYRDRKKQEYEEQEDQRRELRKGKFEVILLHQGSRVRHVTSPLIHVTIT